jgi:hypothetical protein
MMNQFFVHAYVVLLRGRISSSWPIPETNGSLQFKHGARIHAQIHFGHITRFQGASAGQIAFTNVRHHGRTFQHPIDPRHVNGTRSSLGINYKLPS